MLSAILILIPLLVHFHYHIVKNNEKLNNCCNILDVSLLYCLYSEFNLPWKDSKGAFNILFRCFLKYLWGLARGSLIVFASLANSSYINKEPILWIWYINNITTGLDKTKIKLKKKKLTFKNVLPSMLNSMFTLDEMNSSKRELLSHTLISFYKLEWLKEECQSHCM